VTEKTMADHFLPDYHHWGNISGRVEEGLKALGVPIRRVPRATQWTGDPPFLVFGCTWHHRNSQGVLTQAKFDADLNGAIADFCQGLAEQGEFLAYPITHKPPSVEGIAYHDWCGAAYPFDLRVIITLDHNIPAGDDMVETGLTFNILTLIQNVEGKTNVLA
jgi:hypothetical protein